MGIWPKRFKEQLGCSCSTSEYLSVMSGFRLQFPANADSKRQQSVDQGVGLLGGVMELLTLWPLQAFGSKLADKAVS